MRKRKRLSPYELGTRAMACDVMRRIAKVAEEGLEAVLKFRGQTFILAVAGDSLRIFRPE
ncbi:MAG: hypothetical protein CMJ77_22740 [Planctomycetaceae bacterium]|nr:hypothetical protein [Planctomycetaceae bacterium]